MTIYLADNIKILRSKAGLTQEHLAIELKVRRRTVRDWEKNYILPDLKNAIALSQIFKVKIDKLIFKKLE